MMSSAARYRGLMRRAAHALAVACLLAACGTAGSADNVAESPEGFRVVLGGSSGPSNATLWDDGRPIDYGNSSLTGLFIEDDVVYAAGRTGLLNRAAVWTDHKSERVAGSGATVLGLWVDDGRPHLVGTSGFTDRGTIWVGDERNTFGEANANATNVTVDGDDVYAAGTIGNAVEFAGLWKNGVWAALDQSEAKVNDLFVSDGKVYIVGGYGLAERAGLWVDGELTPIDNVGVVVNHLFVEDGVVYFAGWSGSQSVAAYWVDGERVDLEENALITYLFVRDGTVFVSGSYGLRGQAAYWVNGERVDVDDPNAEVHLIFVTADPA